jgi:hypothetical protein
VSFNGKEKKNSSKEKEKIISPSGTSRSIPLRNVPIPYTLRKAGDKNKPK